MDKVINFTVNNKLYSLSGSDGRTLLRFLRDDLYLTGAKNGCSKGHCGTCTVLINGKAKRACITKLGNLEGAQIETIEFGNEDKIIRIIQQAFVAEGSVQCGFCTPGMIMATKAVILKNSTPSEAEIKEGLKYNLCRCTGYTAIIRAVKRAASTLLQNHEIEFFPDSGTELIGKPVYREDGFRKVSGEAVYADDMYEENMLSGKIKFSDYPHAEIVSIDISAAMKIDGVQLVLTGADVPGRNSFGITIPQQPVLAESKVQYEGDMVAAVFAENEAAAEAGVKAIVVTYKPLPIIQNPEQAKASEIFLNDADENLAETLHLHKGDVDKGFRDCDVVVEGEYEVPFVEHAYLEPESCFAKMDGDILTIWTPSQDSVHMNEMIQAALNRSADSIRVILATTGGAFGGKQEPTIQIAAALGAVRSGRPVKITLTREESIRVSTKRHPAKIKMKHGAMKTGKLVALEAFTILDAGAYHSETRWVNFRACVAAGGPYEIPNVRTSAQSYYTNNPPTGAFRGFGSTQVCFAYEIQMDRLARKLNIDPIRIREINALKNGGETITGQVLESGVGFPETIQIIKNRLIQTRKALKPTRPGVKIGIGVASSYKNVGIGLGTVDDAGAEVELLEDGRFEIRTGSAEMGQGTSSLTAQIAAHELHVPYEDIRVRSCDTAVCPQGGVTTASRQTFVTGNAVRLAAAEMRTFLSKRNMDTIGNTLEQRKQLWKQLKRDNEKTFVETRYAPPKTYGYREIGDHSPGTALEEFNIHYAYCFNTCAVIIEADETTGKIEVKKIIEAQDAGKAINPQMVMGQIEGAAVMGFGYGLTEDFRIENGHVLTDTLHKLHIPKIEETPDLEVYIVEELHSNGPYGAKGLGEVPINPVAPAISNAIYDALGIRMTKIPIKPEDVLRALENKKQEMIDG